MDAKSLSKPGGPWGKLLLGKPEDAFDQRRLLSREEPRQLTIRHLDGQRMATKESCLNEFAAALQFPPYFGRNWDACLDCLDDLAGKSKAGLVLFVFHAVAWMKDAPDSELRQLVEVLNEVSLRWTAAKAPAAFRVIFQTKPAEADELKLRWKKAGATLA